MELMFSVDRSSMSTLPLAISWWKALSALPHCLVVGDGIG
jgi:hypothetical protein